MYVRGQPVRLIKSTHADEPDGITGPGIVTPERYTTGRAPENFLPLAAVGWRINELRCATLQHDPVGLNQRIVCKR